MFIEFIKHEKIHLIVSSIFYVFMNFNGLYHDALDVIVALLKHFFLLLDM
jgi:hypothetical protein